MSEPLFSNTGIGSPTDPAAGGEAGLGGLGELRRTTGEVLRVLSVRRWMFFVPFCLVISASFILSLYVPRRYTASTKFERRDDPVLVNLPSAGGMGAFDLYRGTLINSIKGVDNLTEVVRNLGLADVPPDATPEQREALIRSKATSISSTLQVLLHKRTTHLDVIEILCTSPSPDRLAELLDATRDFYIRRTRARFTEKLRQTRDWFDEQRRSRRDIVAALERDLDIYKSDHLGIDPLDLNDSFTHLGELRRDVDRLERKRRDILTTLEGRKALLASRPPAPVETVSASEDSPPRNRPAYRSAETIRVTDELEASRKKIESLRVTRGMTERHPEMAELMREEQQLAGALKKQEGRDIEYIKAHPMAEVIAVRAAPSDPWAAARARIENDVRIQEQLNANNRAELTLATQTMEAFAAARTVAQNDFHSFRARRSASLRADRERELYEGYSDQINRVLSAEGAERGVRFEKIKPASTNLIPASPRIASVVIFSLLAGVATGVVLTLMSELFDRTIRSRSQIVRGLGLPILESIDEIVSAVARRRRFLRRVLFVPALTTTFAAMVLMSATVAYLSLHKKHLYDRIMVWPRSAVQPIVSLDDTEAPVTLARATREESTG